MRKLGVIGGRFDPVHNGHLILAVDIRESLGLDEILFLVSHHPPHKPVDTPFEHRLAMVELAIRNTPGLRACSIERELDLDRSYTVSVLEALLEREDDPELYFLLGSDQFSHLSGWYRPERLGELSTLVVMRRPGGKCREPEVERLLGEVKYFGARQIDISSSEIRERVRKGLKIRFFVPKEVEEYIIDRGLYSD
jgi:nicotinate-nucleotide adenylyltransferase